MSDDQLPPGLIVNVNSLPETSDLLLELELDDAYIEDNTIDRDESNLQSQNEDSSPNDEATIIEDKEVLANTIANISKSAKCVLKFAMLSTVCY